MEETPRQINVRPEEFSGLFSLYLEAYNVNQLSIKGIKPGTSKFKKAWQKFVEAFEAAHWYYEKEEVLKANRAKRGKSW